MTFVVIDMKYVFLYAQGYWDLRDFLTSSFRLCCPRELLWLFFGWSEVCKDKIILFFEFKTLKIHIVRFTVTITL